jgi:hypothetical protein
MLRTPARRSSLTSRSWTVGLSGVGADDVDIELSQRAAELGDALVESGLPWVTLKMLCLSL